MQTTPTGPWSCIGARLTASGTSDVAERTENTPSCRCPSRLPAFSGKSSRRKRNPHQSMMGLSQGPRRLWRARSARPDDPCRSDGRDGHRPIGIAPTRAERVHRPDLAVCLPGCCRIPSRPMTRLGIHLHGRVAPPDAARVVRSRSPDGSGFAFSPANPGRALPVRSTVAPEFTTPMIDGPFGIGSGTVIHEKKPRKPAALFLSVCLR